MNVDKELKPILVGIGSSAGGLEALQAFVKTIPNVTPFSFIIAQHLSPTHISLLKELLARETKHNVVEAKDGQKPEFDHIYVCPPNNNIIIKDGLIKLSEPDTRTYGVKPSVDLLFESLSESEYENCAGIILSGTGSDGSRGVRSIKAAGGITVAQETSTAKYDGMPLSAINTGNIDIILSPEHICEELIDIFKLREDVPEIFEQRDSEALFKTIINKLSKAKKVDFSRYKQNTLKRRILRRISALKIDSLQKYSNFLEKNSTEIDELYNDVLINVTSFFREPESFDSLKKLLQEYLEQRNISNIRIWVPGCSTGEEALTIAIILSEIISDRIDDYRVQIFATDIDYNAIETARLAFYSASAISQIPIALRRKYFTQTSDAHYKPINLIRDMCIYSVHDVIKDPPFLRLDLISCRNMLIYFTSELQNQIINNFHYGLNNKGILCLGKSETILNSNRSFNTLDAKNKIYSVSSFDGERRKFVNLSSTDYRDVTQISSSANKVKHTIEDTIFEHVNKYIIPTCVVINEVEDLVFVKGENPYIVAPQGERTDNIYKNIHSDLNIELRTALHNMNKNRKIIKTIHKEVKLYGGVVKYVRMILIPIDSSKIQNMILICFQEENEEYFKSYIDYDASSEKENQLKLELDRTKSHMQTLLEEMESTNEEMQSLNEELQSSNEELQSSNEELETTNEELQSTNEELNSAYNELQSAYDAKKEEVKQHLHTKQKLERYTQRLDLSLQASKLGVSDQHVPIVQNDIWSERFTQILGYSVDELPKNHKLMKEWFESKLHPDQKEDFLITLERFLRGDELSAEFILKLEHKNKTWIWVKYLIKSTERDADGRVLRYISTLQDISKDKEQAEQIEKLNTRLEKMVQDQHETILSQQSRLAQITQETGVGIWEYDLKSLEITLSPKMKQLMQVSSSDELQEIKGFGSYFDISSKKELDKKIKLLKNKKLKQSKIHTNLKKDSHKWLMHNLVLEESAGHKSIVGICVDISKEIRREHMLSQMVDNLHIIEEFSEIGSFDYHPNKNLYFRSDNFCKLLDLDPVNQTAIHLDAFISMIDKEKEYKQMIEKCLDTIEPYKITYQFINDKGVSYNIIEKGKCIVDQDSKEILIKGIIKLQKSEAKGVNNG